MLTVAAALEIQKANGLAPFTHGPLHYSLLGRDVERDVPSDDAALRPWHDRLESAGFRLPQRQVHPGDASEPGNRYAGFDILPFDKEHGFAVVERLRAIAMRHDSSVAQAALAWLPARPSVTSVLVGSSKLAQLDDNLGAADVHLTSDDIAELDAATPLPAVYPNWYIDSLTDQPVNHGLTAGEPTG